MTGELMLHVDTFAVAVHVRPLGSNTVRLTVPKGLPLRVGDRTILRDPGRQRVVAGALVLDADPPALGRRGAAAVRGRLLAGARPCDRAISLDSPDNATEVLSASIHRSA